jgi:hypothetical protein
MPLPQPVEIKPLRTWHLLTQSYGGTVSLLKDLDQHECEFARGRALGNVPTGQWQAPQPGDIKTAECFQ